LEFHVTAAGSSYARTVPAETARVSNVSGQASSALKKALHPVPKQI